MTKSGSEVDQSVADAFGRPRPLLGIDPKPASAPDLISIRCRLATQPFTWDDDDSGFIIIVNKEI